MCKIFEAVLFLVIVTIGSECTTFYLQAEEYLDHSRSHQVRTRDEALGSRTLLIPAGEEFIVRFCLTRTSVVAIEHVSLVNEIPLTYSLDYKTGYINQRCTNESHCMDDDHSVTMPSGQHFIKISNSKRSNMVDFEIDYLAVYVDDLKLQIDVFRCQVFCFKHVGKSTFQKLGNHKLPSATVENLSHQTLCAEVDNVRVPIFHSHPKKIEVRATHPGYKTFYNHRHPDFSNCKIDNTILWRVENTNLRNVLSYGEKFYIARDSNDQRSFSVKFYLEGVEQDSVDSDIGTVLTLRLGNVSSKIEVALSYLGREEKIIRGGSQYYSRTNDEITWHIPDFTFSDKIENQILLSFASLPDDLFIKLLILKKRTFTHDKRFKMYDGNGIAVEGLNVDFWWLQNQTMSVYIKETEKTYTNVHYLVIYVLKPWTKDSWAQVLVLYQDGNARMLPVTQEGVDWIPFGSSILIGESDRSAKRPHAAISHVDFLVDDLSLKISYTNGNSLQMQVVPDFDTTSLILTDINFTFKYPLLTFRSMYVKDGNSDVDHVIVDDGQEFPILSNWKDLSGTSIKFFRKCISRHNTHSPDLTVYFLE